MNNMLAELQKMAVKNGHTLYNICFRNAGVGFMWYNGPSIEDKANIIEAIEAHMATFENHLIVYGYWPNMEEALSQELARFSSDTPKLS